MGEDGVSMNKPRTLIIGLDGATFDLITPWVRAGHLPTLGRLMSEGAYGPLRAWPNMSSASAWTSMVTGCNPGQHGIYGFTDVLDRQGQGWHAMTALDRQRDPFWCLLSAAGQRVGIVNVPISYPADPVEGFMLSGMDAPGLDSPGFAHPAGLLDELRQQGIDYHLDVPYLGITSQRAPHQLPRPVERMVDARAATVLYLMQARRWDLLMAVFVATDRMQHFYWPARGVPLDDPAWTPVRATYQQIDGFLAQALELVGDNTTVLLVSDHGFGPSMPAECHLNQILAWSGLLRFARTPDSPADGLLKDLLLHGRHLLPQGLHASLAHRFPGLHRRAINAVKYQTLDWSRTQAYGPPYGETLLVNLQGRQPQGIVSPQDYEPLRDRLGRILLDLVDTGSGQRLVRGVHGPEELYHGPHLAHAPDLTVYWEYDLFEHALGCSLDGEAIVVQGPGVQSSSVSAARPWSGTHRPDGIVIAWGPDIEPGATVSGATLYDIAPTILYLQGQPIPTDLDGEVLAGIFAAERLRRTPVEKREPIAGRAQMPATTLDPDELGKIEERLRGLGYIE